MAPRKSYPGLSRITDDNLRRILQQLFDKLDAAETAANTNPLDSALANNLKGGGKRLVDVADPIRPQDAVTKAYLERLVEMRLASAGVVSTSTIIGSHPSTPAGTAPPPPGGGTPPGGNTPPIGPSRGNNRCFMDNGGNFLAFGATLFWGFWGFNNERDRLAQNLNVLRDGGVQYIRVLGAVGPSGGWSDRIVDPTMPDYATLIAAFTDWVYDNFGMRVQWTIIGGTDKVPSSADRSNLMTTFATMASGREHKIFAFEVCNEPDGKLGLSELRTLTTNLQNATTVLVAAGSANNAECGGAYGQQAIYASPVGDFVTSHFPRSVTGTCGVWRPVRQPWEAQFCAGIPILTSNNEPIGPESSVAADDDPLRLAAGAAVTYIAGVGAYVLHCGAGVRGGGAADQALGRKANFWEYPNLGTTFAGMRNVRNILASDVCNWTRHNTNNNYPNRPWDTNPSTAIDDGRLCRLYNADSGGNFFSIPVGILQGFDIVARRNMSVVRFHDILSGNIFLQQSLNINQSIAIDNTRGAFLISGTYA